jgi:hypothetical protein
MKNSRRGPPRLPIFGGPLSLNRTMVPAMATSRENDDKIIIAKTQRV